MPILHLMLWAMQRSPGCWRRPRALPIAERLPPAASSVDLAVALHFGCTIKPTRKFFQRSHWNCVSRLKKSKPLPVRCKHPYFLKLPVPFKAQLSVQNAFVEQPGGPVISLPKRRSRFQELTVLKQLISTDLEFLREEWLIFQFLNPKLEDIFR